MLQSDISEIETKDTSYVVGIGASAGGLEAIHELFDNMPDDTNFSFVIVQHLSPDYKSLMVELLSKHTNMNVYEAKDLMTLEPNSVYVIPTKKRMTYQDGQLHLTEKVMSDVPNTAIDTFLSSLGEEKGKHAIAIILSGTGTDGSRGIAKIKSNGGIVIVQDPISAKFDGMPNSAISTGCADLILAPELMGEELAEYLKEAPLAKAFKALSLKDEAIVNEILSIVKNVTKHDFQLYKRPTIGRRITKRMVYQKIPDLKTYLDYINSNPEEAKLLSKEFLIGVTKFFRDAEAFEELTKVVIPAVVAGKKEAESVKLWVVACSTGEEAYSIAILFAEYLTKNAINIEVKIFATDLDKAAIDYAAKGLYPEAIAADISPERLNAYFIPEGAFYRVSPEIRKMVVFAHHDVLSDPPFGKLDFLSCRNMLIYMNIDLQKKILKTFHFALNENGYLFLGPSENIGVLKDSMKEVDKKWKIYKNLIKATLRDRDVFLFPAENRAPTPLLNTIKSKNALHNTNEIFKEVLVNEFKFSGIYIDTEFEVKHADGNYRRFLNFPAGKFNFNLLKMVPPDLSIALSTGIRKALKSNEKVVLNSVKIHDESGMSVVKAIIQPYVHLKEYLQPFVFIVLWELASSETIPAAASAPTEGSLQDFSLLETELKETRENLQAVVEELETANEELQSSNEEMLSSNEELQSTNEELQSLNEELHTVNAEHQLKIRELIELNDDLNNYFRSTEMGQILIDRNLIIRKFSPITKSLINIKDADMGRSITDFSHNLTNLDFINNIKEVMKTSEKIEKEVTIQSGTYYQMRISPYIRLDKEMDGVVVTFIDITKIKQLSSLIEGIFNSSLSGIAAFESVRDDKGAIVDFNCIIANNAAQEIGFEWDEKNSKHLLSKFAVGYELNHFDKYVEVVENGYPVHFEFKSANGEKWYEYLAVKMEDGFVVTISNITESKKTAILLDKGYNDLLSASNKLKQSNIALEKSNFDLLQFASVASHDLKEPLRKIQIFGERLQESMKDKLGADEEEFLSKIMKSSERMKILIDDLLSISKLSNKDELFSKVDLNQLLNDILEDLEVSIKEKKAQIVVDPLPTINAIPGQIRQLFQNIIVNAMKYNVKNPLIKISNTVKKDDKGKDILSITVKDNGIGFDSKYKEKIFGIFQRLHAKGEYEGTGIGLAICKKIVENHKGTIEAESVIDEGTTFIIEFPL
jgi:two-component system CheB/CheR fusion protein